MNKQIYHIMCDGANCYLHYDMNTQTAMLQGSNTSITIPQGKFMDFIHTMSVLGIKVRKL